MWVHKFVPFEWFKAVLMGTWLTLLTGGVTFCTGQNSLLVNNFVLSSLFIFVYLFETGTINLNLKRENCILQVLAQVLIFTCSPWAG